MNRGVKRTLTGLFSNILTWYSDAAIQLVKIRAVSMYVKAVGAARMALIAAIAIKCVMGLMLAGFILAHIALAMFLPLSMTVKGVALLVLACIYFLIGVITICVVSSQRLWMKYSKASDLVQKILSEN